jgi:carboxylesterase type B
MAMTNLALRQAIVQSPGLVPRRAKFEARDTMYKYFEKSANCSNLNCLRQAPTEVLKKANSALILEMGEAIGPVVDGDYVPDLPMRLLARGKFHRSVKSVISANTGFEVRYICSTL